MYFRLQMGALNAVNWSKLEFNCFSVLTSLSVFFLRKEEKREQAMMTLQGMADHRFTSVSLSTNVFLGEIIFTAKLTIL